MKGKDNRWYLVGLTSWGPAPCGIQNIKLFCYNLVNEIYLRLKGLGTVYTRLSGFKDWILSNIHKN